MASKQNDLMLNILANPQMGIGDFQKVGLSADNTSLEDEKTYLNSKVITENPLFQNASGEFDQVKFHQIYLGAAQGLEQMAKEPKDFQAVYSKYNIFAPVEQRDFSPQFELTKLANPDRITRSMITLGQDGNREYTPAEIAQSQGVLDSKTGNWMDTPENLFSFNKLFTDPTGFFSDNFGSTKVLATYDEDEDINGKKKGEQGFDENNVVHYKGEYKLNDNGTYYYRTLEDGENIYGKQVLHYSDILTREGSALNSIDFLDSDDIQKTGLGSFVKNASLIGTMFLPYVGPVIAGATIFQQAAGLGATLGKIALGSDNSTMNWIEGLVEATNPMNTRSEWSQFDASGGDRNVNWTIENLLGMVGDVVGQLKQQRLLFKYAPIITKGKWGISEKNQELLKNKYIGDLTKASRGKLTSLESQLVRATSETEANALRARIAKASSELQLNAENEAASMIENYMKGYYKSGEELSKAYMTMLTVNDIYGEAKEAGASDFDSALVTAGYAAMEYALLSTDIGKWILPELRADRLKNKAVVNALTKDTIANFEKLGKEAVNGNVAKRNYLEYVVNKGKEILKGEFAVGLGKKSSIEGGQGLLKAGAGSVFAGALAEGTEETAEEVLADFSRVLFNGLQRLKGNDKVQMTAPFSPESGMFDRYVLSFLGGFVGGGVSSAAMDFSEARRNINMDYNKAMQEIIYMARNNDLGQIYKILDKEEIGNSKLSASKFDKDEDGTIIWKQAEGNDNQDFAVKSAVRRQLQLIQNTLDAHGGNITDSSLLDVNTLRDIRFRALQQSTTAGRFIQSYNETLGELIDLTDQLNKLDSPQVKAENEEGDQKDERSENLERKRKKLRDKIKKVDERIENFTSGKLAPLFMTSALLESTPFISKVFLNSNFKYFAESKARVPYDEIPESELEGYQRQYQEYLRGEKKNELQLATDAYLGMTKLIKQNFEESVKVIQDSANDPIIKQLSEGFNTSFNLLQMLEQDEDSWQETFGNFVQSNYIGDQISEKIQDARNTLQQFQQEINTQHKILNDAIQANSEGFIDDSALADTEAHVNEEINKINEAKKELESKIGLEQQKIVVKKQITDAINTAEHLIQLGYLNGQVKDFVLAQLTSIQNLADKFDSDSQEQAMDDSLNGNDDLTNYLEELGILRSDLKNKIESVKKLKYTPILQNLDTFALNIKGSQISKLLETLGNRITTSKDNISSFNLDSDLYSQINEAIRTIELYEAAIEGARVDTVDPFKVSMDSNNRVVDESNIWGINKTLNEVHQKSPKIENDIWEDLPEVEGNVANMMLQDVQGIKNLLLSYKRLYKINKGQKLNVQTRVSSRTSQLLYSRVKRLLSNVDVPDNEKFREAKFKFETLLGNLSLLKDSTSSDDVTKWNLNFSQKDQSALEKERIQMEDGLFDFFQESGLLEDSKLLKDFLSLKNIKILSTKVELLSEGSETIDETSFVGYLAAKASIKSSEFHSLLKETIKGTKDSESPIAPLISQELGVSLALANILNGSTIAKFSTAYRESVLEHFKSKSFAERKKLLKDLGESEAAAALFSTDTGFTYFINHDLVPQYDNITFVDGIPGAGKSAGVQCLVVTMLQSYPELLKNVWVAHGGDSKTSEQGEQKNPFANKFRQDIGLESDESKTFNKEGLMKSISEDWNLEPDGDGKSYDIPKTAFKIDGGKIIPTWNTTNSTEIPSLIIIDEAQQFTQLDLLLIDKFAKEHGIAVIMSGDLQQSRMKGKLEIPSSDITKINKELKDNGETLKFPEKTPLEIALARNQVLHTPKLGTSMRTTNSQKDYNLSAMQAMLEQGSGSVTFKYYENDEGLFTGDLVISPENSVDRVTEMLDKLIPKLEDGEKINFAYDNKESNLYKVLSTNKKYSDYINFIQGTALGQEGRYWIMETSTNIEDVDGFLSDVYTGISRAKEGCMLVVPPAVRNDVIFNSTLDPETHNSISYNKEQIKKFAENRLQTLENIKGDNPSYQPREEVVSRTVSTTVTPVSSEESLAKLEEEQRKQQEKLQREAEEKLRQQEEERINKLNEKANLVKGQDNFIIPSDISYTAVPRGITFSDQIPVSKEWLSKHGQGHLVDEIGWIKQIKFNDHAVQFELFDSEGNKIDDVLIEKNLFETFDNQLSPIVEPINIEEKAQNIFNEIQSSTFERPVSPAIYTGDSDGNIIVKWNTQVPINEQFLLKSKSLDDIKKDLDSSIQYPNGSDLANISYIKIQPDGTVKLGIDSKENSYEWTLRNREEFEIIFGKNFINFEINEDTGEEDPISEFDSIQTESESQEVISNINVESNPEDLNQQAAGLGIEDFNFILYSNASFELGTTIVNREANIFDFSPIPNRIDSVNGLKNVPNASKIVESKDLREAEKFLARIRKICIQVKSKSQLESILKNALGLKGSVYVRFAIKTSEFSKDGINESNSGYNKLEKDENEPTPYSRAQVEEESRANKIVNRSLVAIIGTEENHDAIEIPLLVINNPNTILHGNPNFADLASQLDFKQKQYESQGLNKGEANVRALQDIRDSLPESASGLKNIINLYLRTNRNIGFIDNIEWTPANGLKTGGPQLYIRRGQNYQVDTIGYIQEDRWISLDEIKSDPTLKVSSIMQFTDKSEEIFNEITGESRKVAHYKHPFVLYTDVLYNHNGKLMETDAALAEEFKYQRQNPDVDQTIKLVYVLPPKFTIQEYTQSLIEFMVNKKGSPLGNQRTAYKVLEAMFNTDYDSFKNLFIEAFGSDTGEQIFYKVTGIIQELNGKSLQEQVDYLIGRDSSVGLQSWNYDGYGLPWPSPVYRQLQNIIKQLIYPQTVTIDGNISHRGLPNPQVQQNFIDLFNRSGVDLFYQVRPVLEASKRTIAGTFALIDSDENGHIKDDNLKGNKSFSINGNISSQAFKTNQSFNEIIDSIVNDSEHHQNIYNGQWTSWDNQPYTKGYSGWKKKSSITTPQETPPSISSNISNKLTQAEVSVNVKPRVPDDNSIELKQSIAQAINQKYYSENVRAFVLPNGELFIGRNNLFRARDVQFIYDSNPFENGQTYAFNVTINGENYEAEFNSNTKELSLTTVSQTSTNQKGELSLEFIEANKPRILELLQAIRDTSFSSDMGISFQEEAENLINSENLEEILDFLQDLSVQEVLNSDTNFDKDLFNDILEIEQNNESCSITTKIQFI